MTTLTTVKPVLLTEATKAILERGRYSKDRTNILNNHKALANDIENIEATATVLGIEFKDTEYTFTVSKTSNGISVYSPYIGQYQGEACIYWGNVRKPIADINLPKTIEEEGKRTVLSFEVNEDGDTLELSLMLPKEGRADLKALRQALKKGNLGELLAQSFTKPKSLSELAPGEYEVIGYETREFQGEVKYTINIKGQGFFNTNTKLRRKLANNPFINESAPATLVVGESTETTSTGYPIVPCDLTTVEDLDIPIFDFD